MVSFSWKYLSMGLIAVLAIGLSIPQAAAHITSNTQHMLQHIYNFVDGIEAKTNNLPSDPADQSLLDEQLESIQADTDDILTSLGGLSGDGTSPKFMHVDINLNPLNGEVADNFVILPDDGKIYSGIITGTFRGDSGSGQGSGSIAWIRCESSNVGNHNLLIQIDQMGENLSHKDFSEVFACEEMVFFVHDVNDTGEGDGVILTANMQYVEGEEITVLAN
jgi:hypothetical protein